MGTVLHVMRHSDRTGHRSVPSAPAGFARRWRHGVVRVAQVRYWMRLRLPLVFGARPATSEASRGDG
jgi:hypothetical protein